MQQEPIVIKKYANRRLYHTGQKSYITLEQLAKLIRDGNDVKVIDNQSKKDITQDTLLQIILYDKKPNSLFSSTVLHQLIRLQEEHLQEFLKFYLSSGLEYFNEFQQNVSNQFSSWNKMWGNMFPAPKANMFPSAQEKDMMTQFQERMMEYEKKIQDLEKRLTNKED